MPSASVDPVGSGRSDRESPPWPLSGDRACQLRQRDLCEGGLFRAPRPSDADRPDDCRRRLLPLAGGAARASASVAPAPARMSNQLPTSGASRNQVERPSGAGRQEMVHGQLVEVLEGHAAGRSPLDVEGFEGAPVREQAGEAVVGCGHRQFVQPRGTQRLTYLGVGPEGGRSLPAVSGSCACSRRPTPRHRRGPLCAAA